MYDTFWRFACERQRIFFARVNGHPSPWTNDPVLRDYRFTNVYRASDRTSQFLIRNVIYSGLRDPDDVVLRVLFFKIFNKAETWNAVAGAGLLPTTTTFDVRRIAEILSLLAENGQSIYSGAYIMPPGPVIGSASAKYVNHLAILDQFRKNKLGTRLSAMRSMKQVFDYLRTQPLLGSFLAFQFTIDINYTEVLNFDENDFVVAGPGARSGIAKCFPQRGHMTFEDVIYKVTDEQERKVQELGLSFETLWGRRLQPIDVQNIFCEVDKYTRVSDPEAIGLGGRRRMKRRFTKGVPQSRQWYPPKWGLNELIAKAASRAY